MTPPKHPLYPQMETLMEDIAYTTANDSTVSAPPMTLEGLRAAMAKIPPRREVVIAPVVFDGIVHAYSLNNVIRISRWMFEYLKTLTKPAGPQFVNPPDRFAAFALGLPFEVADELPMDLRAFHERDERMRLERMLVEIGLEAMAKSGWRCVSKSIERSGITVWLMDPSCGNHVLRAPTWAELYRQLVGVRWDYAWLRRHRGPWPLAKAFGMLISPPYIGNFA